jgi:hypothetical protein
MAQRAQSPADRTWLHLKETTDDSESSWTIEVKETPTEIFEQINHWLRGDPERKLELT